MKKNVVVIIVLIVGILIWWWLSPRPTPATNGDTGDVTAAVSTNQVAIINFSFSPANITVSTGTTVTWTNNDQTIHDLVVDDISSPELKQGDTFAHTFNTPGNYNYSCGIHPSMNGIVTVK